MTNITLSALIETYLDGWKMGDGELSLTATSKDFTYDDPDTGIIQRQDFVEFVNDFKRLAQDMGAEEGIQPFLKYSDIVIKQESEQTAIVWCWWQANGTDLQGSAVIKVNEQGVIHEKIAYFSKLP